MGANRGSDSEFTRRSPLRDADASLGAEFELGPSEQANIFFIYLVVPFGFAGPPGIFGRLMKAVQHYSRNPAHPHPLWNGVGPFQKMYFRANGCFSRCV